VKPPVFAYHRPGTLAEALDLLAEAPDAKPLAGGQSLIPAMNFRLAAPAALVDLNGLTELAGITAPGDESRDVRRKDGGDDRRAAGLRLGAMTRHRALETSPLVRARAPLLAETMPHVAHPQIRNRGTIGGSLAHADPAAELPAVMVALEAEIVARSVAGERRVPAERFFTGLFATALGPGELVTAVDIPAMPARTGSAFQEMARRHGDYALVGVAALVTLDERGHCAGARIVLLSVGEGPVLATRAAAVLAGSALTPEALAAAAQAAGNEDIDPPSDIHAGAAYRRQLARVLTRRALERAVARARGEGR
jgi:CO/xanthine dehydrogenase FAD-binding subunit